MKLKECANWLSERDNFLILTHVRPDGDTLGSAAALCSALRRAGKNAALYNNTEITSKYKKYIADYISEDFSYDYVVAVDVAEEKMLANGFEGKVDLCIDHHPKNPHYADELLLDGTKSACGEIVLPLIKELCGDISPEEASCLYIAVSTDCGCFSYANVNADTFAAASELARCGASVRELNYALFRQVTKARMLLEGMICEGLKFYKDGRVCVATVTLDMMEKSQATENDCDDLAGIPGKVEGAVVSILIRELSDGKCKISARCDPSFDVSVLCAKFGGGGHKMASGCTICASPEESCKLLIEAIDEDF